MAVLDFWGFNSDTRLTKYVGEWESADDKPIHVGPAEVFGDNVVDLNNMVFCDLIRPHPVITTNTIIVGMRILVPAPGSENDILALYFGASNRNLQNVLLINRAGILSMHMGASGNIGASYTGLTVISNGVNRNYYGADTAVYTSPRPVISMAPGWNYVEIAVKIDPTNGSVECHCNGEITLPLAQGFKTQGANGDSTLGYLGVSGYCSMTHGYIADTTGPAPNNTFLGDVRVIEDKPNASGSHTDFAATGAASNWQVLSTQPYDPAIFNTNATVGAYDLVGVPPLPAGVGTVFAVSVKNRASKTTSGQRTLANLLLSGTVTTQQAASFLNTTPTIRALVVENDPATSAPWLPAAVGNIQVGYKIVA